MAWTDERIDKLRSLWAQGLTASQIADELGGVSRNAVIGKAHRLGLESRPSPVRPGDGTAPDESARAESTAEAAEIEPEPRPAPPPAPAPAPAPAAPPPAVEAPVAPPPASPVADPQQARPGQVFRSIGPGGFQRQQPGEQQAPIPPAPPRRLVPAKTAAEFADKTSLLDLNDRICKWPMGHPGEADFHFCGEAVNPGFPYCVQHCGLAYQAQLPRRDRRSPPLPFGGPRR